MGYLVCNIKDVEQVHIGDTISLPGKDAAEALSGYKPPQRMVYCGLYPSEGENFEELRESLERLAINDPSFEFQPESSEALGFGFRCGFLGLLHMEIIQQRLEQESDLDLVQTAPNVTYQLLLKNGKTLEITNPQDVPDTGQIEEFRQPIVRCNFLVPVEFIGPVMQLCSDRRGVFLKTEYLSPTRAMLSFDLPLGEVIYDLHDKIKSVTRGYGTLDYELQGYFPADLARLDILVGGKKVDALSIICDRRDADRRRAIVKKLRGEIDRHMFEVALQAAIGTKIIARETISALRKNVTAKCYGGDISRKKLWAKQRRQEADEEYRLSRYSSKGLWLFLKRVQKGNRESTTSSIFQGRHRWYFFKNHLLLAWSPHVCAVTSAFVLSHRQRQRRNGSYIRTVNNNSLAAYCGYGVPSAKLLLNHRLKKAIANLLPLVRHVIDKTTTSLPCKSRNVIIWFLEPRCVEATER